MRTAPTTLLPSSSAAGESGVVGVGDDERFVLTVAPRPRMYVFGAIDFASSLATLGRFLGYHVTVCDARAAFVTPERFPDADELVVQWPHEFIAGAHIDERSAICVLTHDAKFDVPALQAALKTPAGYIGAMGSRRTTARREERLREEGLTDRDLARIHAPIGLSISSKHTRGGGYRDRRPDRSIHAYAYRPHRGCEPVIIENSFEVPGTPDQTLKLLLDAERVVPCMPGAELVEIVDDRTWKAKMRVKLGPVGMQFRRQDRAGRERRGQRRRQDERQRPRHARQGRGRGHGGARFAGVDSGTRVDMTTDLRFSGQVAQLGRPDVVQDVVQQARRPVRRLHRRR